MARLAGCLSMRCSSDLSLGFTSLALVSLVYAVSRETHEARCTCRRRIQQVKTGMMPVRYFRTEGYKLLVNEPACGIILLDGHFAANNKSSALVFFASAVALFGD